MDYSKFKRAQLQALCRVSSTIIPCSSSLIPFTQERNIKGLTQKNDALIKALQESDASQNTK